MILSGLSLFDDRLTTQCNLKPTNQPHYRSLTTINQNTTEHQQVFGLDIIRFLSDVRLITQYNSEMTNQPRYRPQTTNQTTNKYSALILSRFTLTYLRSPEY